MKAMNLSALLLNLMIGTKKALQTFQEKKIKKRNLIIIKRIKIYMEDREKPLRMLKMLKLKRLKCLDILLVKHLKC